MSTYTIYKAPGWHGEPEDPVLERTDDEQYAAMTAGCRVDLSMPGDCNPYDAYALDEEGEEIERIESYLCQECGELIEWGEYGPTGMLDGMVLDCPGGVEKHLVTWVCDDCAESSEARE